MDNEQIIKVEKSIQNLIEKKCKIYFLVQDTKGNAKAGIKYIYDIAYTLHVNGFNPIIMHEKNDFTKIGEWSDEKYDTLEHESIENQNLKISPEDFIVIPELYGHVLEQVSNLPCGKIVLSQSYDYIFETLQPGMSWTDYGFLTCITTSEEQKNYISQYMKNVNYKIITPLIDEKFTPKEKPSKPIITIHTRDQRETAKIIKSFYLKYPQYRWVTFRDMRGLNNSDFAKYLKDSFVSVWVDDKSGFGTYPIESILSLTPVIGKVPDIRPSWMTEENGIWTEDINSIVDILSDFTQNWLEDNISDDLYDKSYESVVKYTDKEEFEKNTIDVFESLVNVRKEIFQSQLERINLKEEETNG
jgi:hypothetical protein